MGVKPQRSSKPPISIEEEDGSPSVGSFTKIKVSNTDLTDNGDGTVSLTTGGGMTNWTDAGAYLHPNTDGDGIRVRNAGNTTYFEIVDTGGAGFKVDVTDTLNIDSSGGLTIDADTGLTLKAGTASANGGGISFVGGPDEIGTFELDAQYDQWLVGLKAAGGMQLILTDNANVSKDHDHAAGTDPVLYVHSATDPDTANTQWLGMWHDQTNAHIDMGTGNLKIAATAAGDITCFEDTDVADAADGKKFYIYRKAVEGDNDWQLYVNQFQDAMLDFNADKMQFRGLGTNPTIEIGTNKKHGIYFGNTSGTHNNEVRQYGYITAATAQKYVQFQVNDTTDNFELTRQDSNIGVFDIQFDVQVPDEVYSASWNGSTEVPTKNAVYDKIETVSTRYIQAVVFDFTADVATGDGKYYIHLPPDMDGFDLTYVHAEVITAGTTGTTDIQIHNVTDAVDVLSTLLTIDSTETGSDTAATPAVINAANDDVDTNDLWRIDVDAVSTTAPKGLIVTLGFDKP